MKKMNNKGFSLVELIIVIAIMAVLVGVLAPQFLRYVENSRVQKDESAMGEVCNAVKIACSVEKVYDSLPSAGGCTTFTFGTASGAWGTEGTASLAAELNKTIPEKPVFSSKTYKGKAATCNIVVGTDATVSVTVVAGAAHDGSTFSAR